jgi:hypothetical protein
MISQDDLVMYIINVPDFQEDPERRNFVAAMTQVVQDVDASIQVFQNLFNDVPPGHCIT